MPAPVLRAAVRAFAWWSEALRRAICITRAGAVPDRASREAAIAAPTTPRRDAAAHRRAHRTPRAAAVLAALLAAAPVATLAAPPAGTPVDNTAGGSATDPGSGATLRPVSNTVRTFVQALEAVALTPRAPITARPGETVAFAHWLRNDGNAPSDFRLDLANQPGDGFDLDALALRIDANRDGLPDPGDPPFTPGGTLPLAAGDSAALIVTGVVPADAPGVSHAHVSLAATSLAQGVTHTVGDSVFTPALGAAPTIAFYADGAFAQITRRSSLGSPLFVQTEAPQADVRADVADSVTIRLVTALTGDVDDFLAVETGPHTGVFRLVPAVTTALQAPNATALVGDGVVALRRGDRVSAVIFGWGASETRASLWVDPAGLVFDAHTDAVIAGARVRLIDVTGGGNGGRPGDLARVLAADGVTPAPADLVTDAQGRYEFPWLAPSTYRLVVTPPEPYRFPSLTPFGELGAGHVLDASGSYGGLFPVSEDGAPVVLDVPADAVMPVVLFAEKTASRPEVELGDDLDYVVRVANRSDSAVTALVVRDALPAGFAYVRGSARLGGDALADPVRVPGGLVFAAGALAPRATAVLAYRVHVGAGASLGEALNRAVAEGADVRSNEAVARVTVRGGVFADEGMILGTVGLDADRDGRLGAGEPGLAGVRIVLDDGTWAVTDANGRYSFAGVSPRTHALKLDPATLPAAATLIATDHRGAGTPGLRFVDLTRGEMRRADFVAVGDTAALRDVNERRVAGVTETARALARGADPLSPRQPAADPRALPASRVLTGESGLPLNGPRPPAGASTAVWPPVAAGTGRAPEGAIPALPAAAAPVAAAPPSGAALAAIPLEQLVPTLDADLGFVGLADLDTVTTDQIAVRVKGRAGTALVLRVNGRALPDSRVARRVIAPEAGIEAWEYLGVGLRPGLNVLEVAPPRSVGRIAVRVVAPGPLATLMLRPGAPAPADGYTAAEVTLALVDEHGVPVGARTLVTLESTLGRVRAQDLDPAMPGTQVAVEGGRVPVLLESPLAPGTARLTARTGTLTAAADVRFVTELRPLLAVGALEGVIGWNGFTRRGAAADLREARFEAPISQFASASRDGRASAAAHGALYMKGRIAGPWSLTAGWDSDRPADERRFRDVQPDAGYALVGDASVRGYDAQSTGQLYTRLERPGAWLLYGDYVTNATSDGARSLAAYSRSLTGAQAHWEDAQWRVDAFTSRDRATSRVEELPARGISGPYQMKSFPFVENTERVEIVVRDREHPGVVLSTTAKTRFTDYEVEPWTGRIVFRAPVPSVDAALNPVFVRITVELRSATGAGAGDAYWVHGGAARFKATPRLELSGTFVDDHDPTASRELRGAAFQAQVAAHTRVEGEWAMLRRLGTPVGHGARVELAHADRGVEARVWGASTGERFDNPSAGFAAGRTEAGGKLSARLAPRTRLAAELSYSGDAAGTERRGGGLLALERALDDAFRAEFGVRASGGTRRGPGDEPTVAALRGKLAWQPKAHPEWSAYGETEQDVREWDRRMAALGAEWRVAGRGRVYARHELISSLGGTWDLNGAQQRLATVVGVDADVRRDQHLFGEYRLADVLAGREAQAAVGLRNGWALQPGLRLGTSFERVSPIGEGHATSGASTAATLGVDFTGQSPWRGSGRIEVRGNRSDTQVLQTLAAAVQLDSAWTGLFRHGISVTNAHDAASADDARLRLQLGLAWRPGGPWEGLARWEFRYDRGAAALSPTADAATTDASVARRRRIANVLSLHTDGRVADKDEISLAWAGKLVRDEAAGGAASAGGGQWLRMRATRDLARGWDVGWAMSALTGRRWAERRWGVGAELGRQLPMGAWMSLGFNRFGYEDPELTGEDWTREGLYLRLRVKLDESLLRRGEVQP